MKRRDRRGRRSRGPCEERKEGTRAERQVEEKTWHIYPGIIHIIFISINIFNFLQRLKTFTTELRIKDEEEKKLMKSPTSMNAFTPMAHLFRISWRVGGFGAFSPFAWFDLTQAKCQANQNLSTKNNVRAVACSEKGELLSCYSKQEQENLHLLIIAAVVWARC